MNPVTVPETLTYIAVFLTFRCTYRCSYCINRINGLKPSRELGAQDWIRGLNRLAVDRSRKVPITLQGGEPGMHPGMPEIISGMRGDLYIDILTNLDYDMDRFTRAIPPERLQRDVPYASIRVSYHPGFSDLEALLRRLGWLRDRGYSIGLFAVEHPDTDIARIRQQAEAAGVDFRTKEFLGMHDGRLYGSYHYPEAVGAARTRRVECRTTEILIAPDGDVHRCHRDLYEGADPVGNILDPGMESIAFPFRPCDHYGSCNPCDVKLKTNRFQEFGYCAVEIRPPVDPEGTTS